MLKVRLAHHMKPNRPTSHRTTMQSTSRAAGMDACVHFWSGCNSVAVVLQDMQMHNCIQLLNTRFIALQSSSDQDISLFCVSQHKHTLTSKMSMTMNTATAAAMTLRRVRSVTTSNPS